MARFVTPVRLKQHNVIKYVGEIFNSDPIVLTSYIYVIIMYTYVCMVVRYMEYKKVQIHTKSQIR